MSRGNDRARLGKETGSMSMIHYDDSNDTEAARQSSDSWAGTSVRVAPVRTRGWV